MFHSDQGTQYTSKAARKLLRMNKDVQSLSKSGQPYDNAVMEFFFASMKREEIYHAHCTSEQQFIKSVDIYIKFYNAQRLHSTLNYPPRINLRLPMRAKKKPQADLDKGFKSGNFSIFNRRFQRFCRKMSILAPIRKHRKILTSQAFSR